MNVEKFVKNILKIKRVTVDFNVLLYLDTIHAYSNEEEIKKISSIQQIQVDYVNSYYAYAYTFDEVRRLSEVRLVLERESSMEKWNAVIRWRFSNSCPAWNRKLDYRVTETLIFGVLAFALVSSILASAAARSIKPFIRTARIPIRSVGETSDNYTDAAYRENISCIRFVVFRTARISNKRWRFLSARLIS